MSVEVGQQDVVAQLAVVKVTYHHHADGVVCITMDDDSRVAGAVGGRNVEGMESPGLRRDSFRPCTSANLLCRGCG